jgi:hypothetical protein
MEFMSVRKDRDGTNDTPTNAPSGGTAPISTVQADSSSQSSLYA